VHRGTFAIRWLVPIGCYVIVRGGKEPWLIFGKVTKSNPPGLRQCSIFELEHASQRSCLVDQYSWLHHGQSRDEAGSGLSNRNH
jgi:hypothetical protein